MLDATKNFAKSTLASGITDVATSLSVVTGDGAKFPDTATAGAFMVVIWDAAYADPSDDPDVEIVRVTTRTGDSFDVIVRGQESTTGVAHNTGGHTYNIILGLTAKMVTDLQAELDLKAPLVSPSFTTPILGAATSTTLVVGNGSLTDFPGAKFASGSGDSGLSSTRLIGVLGEAAASDALNAVGVYGVAKSSASYTGIGVYGYALVNAATDGVWSYGGYFYSGSAHTVAPNVGIYGQAATSTYENMGVYGYAQAPATASTYVTIGIYGVSKTNSTNSAAAIYGYSQVTNTADSGIAYGGYFTSSQTHSGGMNIAGYFNASGGSSNWGVYVNAGHVYVNTGRVGFGVSPSASLHIRAGTADASSSPIKLTAGVNMTAPEDGAIEYDGTNLFFTPSSASRQTITTNEGTGTLSNKTIDGELALADNSSIAVSPELTSDGLYTGITRTGTAGAALSFGQLVYLDPSDSRWELVDANSASGADGDARGLLAICILAAAADGDPTKVLLWGTVRADTAFPELVVNGPIYASESAGEITTAQPSSMDVVIRVLGFGLTINEMMFCPETSYITHG